MPGVLRSFKLFFISILYIPVSKVKMLQFLGIIYCQFWHQNVAYGKCPKISNTKV